MSRRTEVTEALLGLLQDEVTTVEWGNSTKGAERGSGIIGTLTCDRILLSQDSKSDREATATYYIYIIDSSSVEAVDVIADTVLDVLTGNPTINNWVTDSYVKRIIFGQATGRPNTGIAMLELEVKFDW